MAGPIVWYQKFEYAVGHWLHKTAEHVFGCVLCSPGCFSLFRAAALMDDNVMKRYTLKSSKAIQHIQYDQGEDRWLCTLLLKQGWRVEYNAAADAYTNAPEDFKEFYNQRRRWGPSTMANIADLLGCTTMISKRNPSISKAYMFYQFLSLVAGILAPSTVVLMIAGSLTVLLDLHPSIALLVAVIPPIIFLGVSFKIKADTQINIAGVLSVIYAFLMIVVGISITGNIVKEGTILTPSSLFIISLASFYLFTAILHPQEIGLICYGFIYLISIPSAYLLLSIYSMVNMNNVSWGTRETAPAAGALEVAVPQTAAQKAKSSITQFFARCKCCRKLCHTGSAEELSLNQEEAEPQPQNNWVTQLQSLNDDMRLTEETFDKEEEQFFRDLMTKYLEPLPENKQEKKEMMDSLRELRNKITFVYFIVNAFWLIVTFTLQLLDSSIFIRVAKINNNLEYTGEYIYIDPVGFMFILIYTLIHYVAFMDTEPISKKEIPELEEELHEEPKTFKEDDGDDSDDSDDYMFPSMLGRGASSGTMV
ncbi:Chitin synthase 8 [Liparis tanakae]|uniref:chitin synthase n=1 Tax=Liparis tanakae TaxID=230148 RepID=A0A4Z2GVG6_9TELE|nr:Chitin synthase 8 [Liparis tanakae]